MKNIVVCCDGTGNQYGDHNTNVVDLYAVLKRYDFRQIGIGIVWCLVGILSRILWSGSESVRAGGLL